MRKDAWPLIILLLVYAGAFLLADEPPLEDAFISFHVLENFIAGEGLVFNPGERVEAYSNFLWVMLLAPLRLLFGDVLPAVKVLSFLTGFAVLFMAYLLLRGVLEEPWERFAAVTAIALCPHFISFCVYGLETPQVYLLSLSAAYMLARQRFLWASGLCGLLALARPDGFIYFGAFTLAAIVLFRRELCWKRWFLPFLAFFAAITLFRLFYYGLPFPNTVYAKGFGSAAIPLQGGFAAKAVHGAAQMGRFFLENFYWPLLVLWIYGTALVEGRENRRRVLCLWAIVIGTVAIMLATGGNFFTRYRFWSVALPPLFLLAAFGLAGMTRQASRAAGLIVMILVSVTSVEHEGEKSVYWGTKLGRPMPGGSFFAQTGERFRRMVRAPDTLNRRLGDWIAAMYPEGALVATSQIGQISYYARRPILDTVGLADSRVAREGASLEYFLERNPACFLELGDRFWKAYPEQQPVTPHPSIYRAPEFRRRYEWLLIITGPPPHDSFYYYVRRPKPLDETPPLEDPPVYEAPLDQPLPLPEDGRK